MANGKLSVLLVVLISSYGIISTEERFLKTDHTNGGSTSTISRDNYLNWRRNLFENELSDSVPPVLGYHSTSDYRPTKPGHSPGAGHSVGPQVEPNQ
ncbi:hypothetical protein D8674_015229 [Pyrus ussuriensis x Pyrus communis]|uniref:Uncharacterized protein n=1 Tax=Pyrus ussuriensis x Pyrus communis TaxID=2448454 RepID=A0A5N5H1X8_9ROSA|nr:hypothetical protein D8674_015229 [Pyrus ussuriensis x Pyrus communis]